MKWAKARDIESEPGPRLTGRHAANAIAALRLTMNAMPLRRSSRKYRRSSTISTHALWPRERPRWTMWRAARRRDSSLRLASAQSPCHFTQPRESSRCMKCMRARDIGSTVRGPRTGRHAANAIAAWRLIMNDMPLRSSCRNARRSATISTHAL